MQSRIFDVDPATETDRPAVAQLLTWLGDAPLRPAVPRPVVLLLPGQGSQHLRMAAGLYQWDPIFTGAIDDVLRLTGDAERIRADWLSERPLVDIDHVSRAQPLLFAVDYALACLVSAWGIKPAALLGHSAGELVGATLGGVVSLAEAVHLMCERVRYARQVPPGGMIAVAATADEAAPYLVSDVAIAAVNAPRQTMLAGSAAPLARVTAALLADGYIVRTVPATTPFHCSAMAAAVTATEPSYAKADLRPPVIPLFSAYSGDLLTAAQAVSPRFWARQLTDTVYFGPALDRLLAAHGDVLLLETGPRQTLTALAARHRVVRAGASVAVPMLPARGRDPASDRRAVLRAAARLWREGHDVDLDAMARCCATFGVNT